MGQNNHKIHFICSTRFVWLVGECTSAAAIDAVKRERPIELIQ